MKEVYGCKHWLNPDDRKPDILVQFNENFGNETVWLVTTGGMAIFRHPTAYALAVGFVDKFQPIQPLLDWALENIALAGRYVSEKWEPNPDWQQSTLRIVLNRMLCAVTNQEEVA